MFDTPILYLIFNRYELCEITFPVIRNLKPKQLFIAADGPRHSVKSDIINCRITRDKVLAMINWDCDVRILFREYNLGCGLSVSSAIDWFFSNVDEGIILEDDCLPNSSFFLFCQEMLNKYRDQDIVGHISGSNLISNDSNTSKIEHAYYFSALTHIWGWATWKRSWKNYNFNLSDIIFDCNKRIYKKIFINKGINKYWSKIFFDSKNKNFDTWDYQWQFCIWHNNQLAITPKVNLITNLGFGENATHTKNKYDNLSNLPTCTLNVITHPQILRINIDFDLMTLYHAYQIKKDKPFQGLRFRLYLIKSILKKYFY